MARRDEPGLSFIVRLDKKKAFILHHASSTYSEFSFPPKQRHLETSFRKGMGAAAGDVYPYSPEGSVSESRARHGNLEVVTRKLTVNSPILGHLEVGLEVTPDLGLGPAAFAVESFAQTVRRAGEQWLSLLGNPDGIPLRLTEALDQPSSIVHYREDFSKLEVVEFSEATFTPPSEYSKVDHVADCFF